MNIEEMQKEENFEHEVLDRLKCLDPRDFDYNAVDGSYVDAVLKARDIILTAYEKEKRENQKKELAILNAKQVEFNKLVNTVNSYKGQFKRQQKEIELLKEENERYKNPPFFDEDNYISKEKSEQKEKEAYNFGYRNGCNDTSKFNDKTFIRIDKIKAKIEPVLKQLERKMEEEYNKYGNSREYQDIVDAYNFLQSLLEKE